MLSGSVWSDVFCSLYLHGAIFCFLCLCGVIFSVLWIYVCDVVFSVLWIYVCDVVFSVLWIHLMWFSMFSGIVCGVLCSLNLRSVVSS